jgi:hypothetical protein
VKLGSRSDIIDTSTPGSLITLFTYNFVSLSTKSIIFIGKNKVDFVSQSTTTHMASFPFFPLGNPVTKSIEISSHFHSGIDNNYNSPAGF